MILDPIQSEVEIAAPDVVAEAWSLGLSVGVEGSDADPIFAGPTARAARQAFLDGLRIGSIRRARELGEAFGFTGTSPVRLYREVARGRFRDEAARAAFAGWAEGDKARARLEGTPSDEFSTFDEFAEAGRRDSFRD